MCDFVKRWFTPPGSGGNDAALANALSTAQRSASDALAAQTQAQHQAQAASDSQSEQSRQAQEEAMRKLLAAGGFGATLPSASLGQAQTGTRQLYGA